MGSYLSAPMLVFQAGVLARACEAPRSDGPAGTWARLTLSILCLIRRPCLSTVVQSPLLHSFLLVPLIAELLITFRVLSAGWSRPSRVLRDQRVD